MVNTSKKGKAFEYAVRDHFRDKGYIAHLLSNSRPFDVVVWIPHRDKAIVVECTCEPIGPSKVKSFLEAVRGIAAHRLLARKDGSGIKFYTLNGLKLEPVEIQSVEEAYRHAAA